MTRGAAGLMVNAASRVYDDYLAELAGTKPEDLTASAVSIIGPRNRISRLVRNLEPAALTSRSRAGPTRSG